MKRMQFSHRIIAFALASLLSLVSLCEAGKVNINTASKRRLERLPGIGEEIAELIIKHRRKMGPFNSIAELREIHGIGDKRLRVLEDEVTVGALAERKRM